jgi:hypothetical protein
VRSLAGHKGFVHALKAAPRYLVSGSGDKTIKVCHHFAHVCWWCTSAPVPLSSSSSSSSFVYYFCSYYSLLLFLLLNHYRCGWSRASRSGKQLKPNVAPVMIQSLVFRSHFKVSFTFSFVINVRREKKGNDNCPIHCFRDMDLTLGPRRTYVETSAEQTKKTKYSKQEDALLFASIQNYCAVSSAPNSQSSGTELNHPLFRPRGWAPQKRRSSSS